jgi:hypothetical protein
MKRLFYIVFNVKGKFRAIWYDGQLSYPMSYRDAKAFIKMFGGYIIDNF